MQRLYRPRLTPTGIFEKACMSCLPRICAAPSMSALAPAALGFAALVLGLAPALAQSAPPGIYVQGAKAEHSSHAFTVGVTLPWRDWETALWGGQLRGYWDVSLSRWATDGPAGRRHTAVVEVTPSFRWTADAGRSPFFLDAGIGGTWSSRRYIAPGKVFSTRFNFATHLGAGYAFGTRRQHEIQLRLQHLSNAGIKKPNPGENFLQLRYGLHF